MLSNKKLITKSDSVSRMMYNKPLEWKNFKKKVVYMPKKSRLKPNETKNYKNKLILFNIIYMKKKDKSIVLMVMKSLIFKKKLKL